ncbi:hypothetical protein EAI91_09015 [Lacticaseibacillus paracasei]|nr:hypothetical protein LPEG9_06850 [Lacticaseibacillus paracasei]NLT81701.1 hypothetical protein [Lacticaseibacillus paracasei subsp. paracasei]PTS56507.1 hypothetical protein DBQ61_08985 [Lactobacillus sp. DS22_6]MCT4394367.1 hypothetical protein [Lacticaseibacillus paracasei]OPH07037.1 hypothetical protein B4586_01050 [Lacticaseibacillus paracasei]
MTRAPAQKPTPFTITRSQAQKPACKAPERNDQNPVITFRATYTPVSKRAGERSHTKKANT